MKKALDFARDSPEPAASLAKELEFPDAPDTDYNGRAAPADGAAITAATVPDEKMEAVQAHITALKGKAADGTISIGDAVSRAHTLHPAPERSPSYPYPLAPTLPS